MSRPLRIQYPGAWYHVMNRGLNRAGIYSHPKDYASFLEVLGEACALFHVCVSAYCLMPNHYHLLVQTPEGNLSRFMRHVNGVYTQRFNRGRKRDGPLFRGRFKGILVQEDSYLVQVVQYIHRNPLKAGLVKKLKDFPWSSHRYYLKAQKSPEWLDSDRILSHFSRQRAKAVALYKDFMDRGLQDDISRFYSKKYLGPILGDDSFVQRIKEKFVVGDGPLDMEVKGKRRIGGVAKVRTINKKVCEYFNIPQSSLTSTRRGQRNIPRQIAISLAREQSGLGLGELAELFHARTYKTIGTSCYRFQQTLKKDKKLARHYARLKKRCSQEEI